MLYVTADARYEVFLNGHWLGSGPLRSWKSPWPVDQYDVRSVLQPGRNVIAVLVQQWGIDTFQYLAGQSGLVAELRWTDKSKTHYLGTDARWLSQEHDSFVHSVPRISCMQAWEEQFDSRCFPVNWTKPEFDDQSWTFSQVLLSAGAGDHPKFVLRSIPQLTRQPVDPVRVCNSEAVVPAPYTWSINPRELLNARDRSANYLRGNMLLATHLYSEVAQKIEFHQPHDRPHLSWKLNGVTLSFDDRTLQKTNAGVAHGKLRSGQNVLMCQLPSQEHYWWTVMNAWTKYPLRSVAGVDSALPQSTWLALGPFSNIDGPEVGQEKDPTMTAPPTGDHAAMVNPTSIPAGATRMEFDRIWSTGSIPVGKNYVRFVPQKMIAAVDVFATCASERPASNRQPQVHNPTALLSDTADWTTIHPVAGANVRLLLDFGREIVGHHEFEVDAPAGTVIDVHNFEFIQPNGRINLSEGMNNTFRYTCKEGVQRYRTLLRRGFRYSWLSFRGFSRPVKVRFVRALMSTYPQQRIGQFACSDPLLERIWETGMHSVHCCSEDTYTDCPTYEQTFWVGDGRNEALVDLIGNGDPRLSARSWSVAAESLNRSPIVESQVPSGWQNLLPAWTFLWMRWAEEHYRLSGDRKLGRYMLQQLRRNFHGLTQYIGPRGLIKIRAWNMFDWAPMDTPSDGEVTHLNCLAVLALRQTARLALELGSSRDARQWKSMADSVQHAVNKHLWDDYKGAFVDCIHADGRRSEVFSQQTQTAAIIAEVPTGTRRRRCRELLLNVPSGFVRAGSPFVMFFLLEVLAREGHGQAMLDTIRSYWGKQVQAGATTFWETYDPGAARMTRSHCHGWSAAPTFFLTQYLLGVTPGEAGYKRVRIEPLMTDVDWCRGTVPTPHGPVRVEWQRTTGGFSLSASVSGRQRVEIVVPSSGKLTIDDGRPTTKRKQRGKHIVELSGPNISIRIDRRDPASRRQGTNPTDAGKTQ